MLGGVRGTNGTREVQRGGGGTDALGGTRGERGRVSHLFTGVCRSETYRGVARQGFIVLSDGCRGRRVRLRRRVADLERRLDGVRRRVVNTRG